MLAVLIALLTSSPAIAAYHPIHWNAPKQCLYYSLAGVLYDISAKSPVVVTSTCRSKAHNRKIGGAKGSYHLRGRAVDFRVRPNKSEEVKQALLADPRVGGWKQYRKGSFHIDTGSRRTWNTRPARNVKKPNQFASIIGTSKVYNHGVNRASQKMVKHDINQMWQRIDG